MKALILNNKVVDLNNTEFEVHSDMTWVNCSDSVEIGDSYNGSSFTSNATTFSDAEKLDKIRVQRNILLQETDYFALSDGTLTSQMTTYRQQLRDLPASVDINNPVYPTKP